MENITPAKTTPILQIAWTRYAHMAAMSRKRTNAFYSIRRWILGLGVVATLFAILTEAYFSDSESLPGLIVKIIFVSAPVAASILAAFSSKFYAAGHWLIYRSGAEEIKKEIYIYRTILQKNPKARAYLEKRLGEIQRKMYQSMSGEFAYEPYNGPIPPHYKEGDPNSDPGFHDLSGDEYFRFRVEDQLAWHNNSILKSKRERRILTLWVLIAGGLGIVFAAWPGVLSLWVAFTASIISALIGWQELRSVDKFIGNYSKVVMELTLVYDHWINLEPEERTTPEFYKMVRRTENILWAQNQEYVKVMQEALQDADLDEEASLINNVIKESVESTKRTQQGIRDAAVEITQEALENAEEKIVEEFKETLGKLAEEASSEIVQKELEAMQKAVLESAQAIMARGASLSSSLEEIARELAGVDIGRDTSKEELNAILARFPKTGDVKG
jgi:hypothetical protein